MKPQLSWVTPALGIAGGRRRVSCRPAHSRSIDRSDRGRSRRMPRRRPSLDRRGGLRGDDAGRPVARPAMERRVCSAARAEAPGLCGCGLPAAHAVFYAETDWLRLAQKLRATHPRARLLRLGAAARGGQDPAPERRGGEDPRARPTHARHGRGQFTGWSSWVDAGNGTWYDAGVLARHRMAAAGFDVTAGDIWGLNELSSAVRQEPATRARTCAT